MEFDQGFVGQEAQEEFIGGERLAERRDKKDDVDPMAPITFRFWYWRRRFVASVARVGWLRAQVEAGIKQQAGSGCVRRQAVANLGFLSLTFCAFRPHPRQAAPDMATADA